MSAPGYTLFDTAIGVCALAWGERGVVGFWLPEATPDHTRARVLRRHPDAVEGAPPTPVQAAIGATITLLAGEPRDLIDIVVELDHLPDFDRRVLDVTRAIPPGSTLTYGQVAARVGEPGAAQAVGKALGRNPIPVIVPCHRVLAAGGKLNGFSAPGGVRTKRRLLEIENARTGDEPDLFDLAR